MFLTALGFFLGGCVLFGAWWVYGWLFLSGGPKSQIFRRRLMRIRQLIGKKGESYELLDREDHSA
jgi:hypothetical protein